VLALDMQCVGGDDGSGRSRGFSSGANWETSFVLPSTLAWEGTALACWSAAASKCKGLPVARGVPGSPDRRTCMAAAAVHLGAGIIVPHPGRQPVSAVRTWPVRSALWVSVSAAMHFHRTDGGSSTAMDAPAAISACVMVLDVTRPTNTAACRQIRLGRLARPGTAQGEPLRVAPSRPGGRTVAERSRELAMPQRRSSPRAPSGRAQPRRPSVTPCARSVTPSSYRQMPRPSRASPRQSRGRTAAVEAGGSWA